MKVVGINCELLVYTLKSSLKGINQSKSSYSNVKQILFQTGIFFRFHKIKNKKITFRNYKYLITFYKKKQVVQNYFFY
jgi:hypothetical protein